jgi:MFS family permease
MPGTVVSPAAGAGVDAPEPPAHIARDVARTVLCSTSGSLAAFLVGALAVELRASLHLSLTGVGSAVGAYFLGAAAGSVPAGRVTDRLGGARTMRGAALGAAAALLLISLLAVSWASLCALMLLAGLASSAMQPATNRFLIRRVPASRQGLAFGIKQASVPLATLLGGLAVPTIGLTVGWRWAFVVGACIALAAAVLAPVPRLARAEARRRAPAPSAGSRDTRALVVLAAGFGLGVLATTGLTTFLVLSAVAVGVGQAGAGLVAALAAATSAAVRIAVGYVADRRGHSHLPMVSVMLMVGVVGYAALGLGSLTRTGALLVIGAVIAYGAGWGWNGLFNFAITRSHRDAPARATGVTQTGGRLAGVLGPTIFGMVVSHTDYAVGWLVSAGAALSGAGVIVVGRRLLVASQARGGRLAPPVPSGGASHA